MTWNSAPWALDGALTNSELARLATYVAVGGAEGVVGVNDLKVEPLATPGGAVRVASGGALVKNRSTGGANQTYAVDNNGYDQVTIASTGAGVTRSDLVVARIKDPQYSPWPAPPVGTEETYQYVESFVISNVPGGTKSASTLNGGAGLGYSAVALARIDLPANTAAVTSGMIVDLRNVARPRSIEYIEHLTATADDVLNPAAGVWESYPAGVFFDVAVPEWAVVAKVTAFAEGVRLAKAGNGKMRVGFFDGGATAVTNINDAASSYPQRRSYNIGGEISVPVSYRGTTRRIRMEGTINMAGDSGFLTTDASSSGQIRVRFEEKAI